MAETVVTHDPITGFSKMQVWGSIIGAAIGLGSVMLTAGITVGNLRAVEARVVVLEIRAEKEYEWRSIVDQRLRAIEVRLDYVVESLKESRENRENNHGRPN